MHCLYCDRPLALLKRLTGDGEFCSKEHRRIYQQEHNQLALARLLESQPKPEAKPRPDRAQKLKPEPSIVELLKPPQPEPELELEAKPQSPQPDLAGFMSETLEVGPAPAATRFSSHPSFKKGSPVWSGIAGASGFRRKPGPRTAGFIADSSRPGFAAGTARLQNKSDFRRPARKFLLEQKSYSAAAGRRQPSRAGFVFGQPAARLSAASSRPPGEARFRPLTPVTASPLSILRSRQTRLRMAKFLSSSGAARTAPGRVRVPAVQTRWKPLSPALPAQTSAKITLVLGSFLQRPVRPASQDFLPETFEIQFQPVSFPQYSPGMECLEERLHRTDRIGFSPP
jgi:hypothetical protein